MSSFLRFLIPSGLLLMLAVSSTLHAATDAPMFAGTTLTIHGETYTWSSATEENYDHNDIYTTAGGQSVTGGNLAVIEGTLTAAANGEVIARFASEIANSAITTLAGAHVTYMALPTV